MRRDYDHLAFDRRCTELLGRCVVGGVEAGGDATMTRTNLNNAIVWAARNGMHVTMFRGTAQQLFDPLLPEGEFMRIELRHERYPERMIVRHVPIQEASVMWEQVAAEITDAIEKLAEYVGLEVRP
jgi:hypothetical protein